MNVFHYEFRGQKWTGNYHRFKQNGRVRYQITLEEGITFQIAPAGLPNLNQSLIWIQIEGPGEIVQPHEFIQAVGEGLEIALN